MPEPLNLGETTPIYAQVNTEKTPTIKVEAPKQPIYIVDKNQQSKPLGLEYVASNKNDKPVIKENPKEVKKTWWSKKTKTEKTIIIGGGIVILGVIGYFIYNRYSQKS
mgnify:CR=1 FL=1